MDLAKNRQMRQKKSQSVKAGFLNILMTLSMFKIATISPIYEDNRILLYEFNTCRIENTIYTQTPPQILQTKNVKI